MKVKGIIMKELKKPKVLIVLMILMIYVVSKIETREGMKPGIMRPPPPVRTTRRIMTAPAGLEK
jgi:hypothetical protein